jgi:hypothetical protein
MSEQRSNYLEQLDQWTEQNVFQPLLSTNEEGQPEELTQETLEQVKKAIRTKVLESYRNGLKKASAPEPSAAPAYPARSGAYKPRR